MKHPSIWLPWVLLILSSGCRNEVSPPAAELERFKDYYAGELYLTERTGIEGSDSTLLRLRLDSLRTAFAFSPRSRDTLLAYFQDSLPRWESFLTDVLRRLEERERILRGEPAAGPDARGGKE